MQTKPALTIDLLTQEARFFCQRESKASYPTLFGVTDGKAVGTYIEHRFHDHLSHKYSYEIGSSANGIDMPSKILNTDIKVTSIRQPQSSCPFRNARQKIYGLGYNLLVFVYDKRDDRKRKVAGLNFVSCSFVNADRTADYQMTRTLRQMNENDANDDDIIAYLTDRNLPADEITLGKLAKEVRAHPPEQGYLTISNALQWRLQYGRIVELTEPVAGIVPIVSRANRE